MSIGELIANACTKVVKNLKATLLSVRRRYSPIGGITDRPVIVGGLIKAHGLAADQFTQRRFINIYEFPGRVTVIVERTYRVDPRHVEAISAGSLRNYFTTVRYVSCAQTTGYEPYATVSKNGTPYERG